VSITIRTRITALYCLVLAGSFFAFFWICDFGFRRSIETTVNDATRANLESIQRVIGASQPRGTPKMEKELAELAGLWANGAIFEVQGPDSTWLYRSSLFLQAHSALDPVPAKGIAYLTRNLNSSQYRIAREKVAIQGQTFLIDAAVPTEPFDQALDNFRLIEKEFLPLLVILASLLGYWLSGRALAPVNRIIRSAEGIGVRELSRRLELPKAKDDLRRLTETLNEMLDRIESSVKRITQFTADASHDLRTPITLIRTNAELALRRSRPEAEYREALTRILNTSEVTTILIEHLLTLARADAGAAHFKFQSIRVSELMQSVSQQATLLALAKGHSFSESLVLTEARVIADPLALERMLLALLDNAVQYTPAGGQISMTMQLENDCARVEIQDTGVGISETDLPRIFDRFFRADQARSGDLRGSGLGLSIAKWIADTHHISIEASSCLGKGSLFSVSIPIELAGLSTATDSTIKEIPQTSPVAT
jgi:heavy metal sensor kinase